MKKLIVMLCFIIGVLSFCKKPVMAYTQPLVINTGIHYPVSLEDGKDAVGNIIFTDKVFLDYLKTAKHSSGNYNNLPFDLNGDGLLSQLEAELVRVISVEGKAELKKLIGIEAFPKLRELYCSGTGITELELNHNTLLQELYCTNTPLSDLDISQCKILRILKLEGCKLCTLDVSGNKNLELFTCNEQSTVAYAQQIDGRYVINLPDYNTKMDLDKIEDVCIDGAQGDEINSGYDAATGMVYCSDTIRNVSYTYDCGTYSAKKDSVDAKMKVNLSIYIGYRQQYETLGGERINPQYFRLGTADYAPKEPKRKGYQFLGWYTDAACSERNVWNFGSQQSENITLYAKWQPKTYTIYYQANGGKLSTEVKTGVNWWNTEVFTEIPLYEGYRFVGWNSVSGRKFEPKELESLTYGMACGDMDRDFLTVTAEWEKKENYQIKVVANIANADMEVVNLYEGDKFSFDSTGICDFSYEEYIAGYRFEGWYMDSEYTKKITEVTSYKELYHSQFLGDLEENIPTIYAKFVPCYYVVSYDTKGGTVFPKRTDLLWDSNYLLPQGKPTRKGYRFLGWKCNGKRVNVNTRIWEICPENSTEIKICAIWKKKYEKSGTEFRRYGYRYRVIKSNKKGNIVKIVAMSRKKLGKKPPKKVFYNGLVFRVKKAGKGIRLT